jgi:hypothetical protein
MNISEKSQIYYNVWCCAYRRRHNAKLLNDWELYEREHQTIRMCLDMKDVKFYQFDSEKPRY